MLTIDVLIALILVLAAPVLLAHLPSLQADLKPLRVRNRASDRRRIVRH